MDETRTSVCTICFSTKPIGQFYQRHPLVCKTCMHGPSPSGLKLVPLSASFTAGLASVVDQIGRMKGENL